MCIYYHSTLHSFPLLCLNTVRYMPVHSGIRHWFLPVVLVNKVVDRVANLVIFFFFFTEVS